MVKNSSIFDKIYDNILMAEIPPIISSSTNMSYMDSNERIKNSPLVTECNTTFTSISDLQQTQINNPLRLIIGQVNINSIRKKFDALMNQIKENMDILMISEYFSGSTILLSRLLNIF